MVNIRYLSLIFSLLLIVNGCAIQTTTTPAQVEDRSRPQGQKAPAETTVKTPKPSAAGDRREPVDDTGAVPAKTGTDVEVVEQPSTAAAKTGMTTKGGPAVVALLDDADKYSVQGNNQQAIASVERALRIEPKNPVLWNRLGRLHLQNGSWVQAITMAKKSNVLAAGNRKLQADNWGIMARARQGLGDTAGANEAMKKARELSR